MEEMAADEAEGVQTQVMHDYLADVCCHDDHYLI